MSPKPVIEVESSSVEPILVTLWTEDDPTAGVVEFQLAEDSVTTPADAWTGGSWDPDYPWNDTDRNPKARTATVGGATAVMAPVDAAGDAVTFTEGSLFGLWVRVGSTVVERVGTVKAT